MAKVYINEKNKKGHINPELYGNFSEHLGRCIYEGLYVGEDSEIPNTKGMRNDVVAALKEMKLPVLRWPGGCLISSANAPISTAPSGVPVPALTSWPSQSDIPTVNDRSRKKGDFYDEENRSDYYPKDMFVQGLTKTTHIDQVDNGELSFELTISGDTYNALTYRSFRMPLYTEGKYDPSAVPEVLGSLGETSFEESSIDVSTAEALPDGWNFLLDGSKISVNGSFLTQTAATDLQAGKMILISGESQRAYQLTQTPSEGDDGTNVTVKGWTAVDGLEGQEWDIYLELDGVLYNTGYMYSQA